MRTCPDDACQMVTSSPRLQGRPPFPAGMPGGDANSGLRADSAPANYAEQQQQVCSQQEITLLAVQRAQLTGTRFSGQPALVSFSTLRTRETSSRRKS